MEKKWRLILDGKGDGYYNMAADEAIFACYPQQKIPTLRIYGWQHPFISLGYNQEASRVLIFKELTPFTRRITGGASILHNKELTYSIVCRRGELNLGRSVKESYEAIASFLINFYFLLGLKAQFAQELSFDGLGEYKNFCYSCYEHFDILINRKKIGGNAQRRKKNIIFQHGSIPQEVDLKMVRRVIKDTVHLEEKITFLNAALGRETDFFQLRLLLAQSFEDTFGVDLLLDEFTKEEKLICKDLIENKYRQDSWNFRYEKTPLA
ncbi:MAG: lipoate--protein ligase family protein [Candidatus Omnitrophica bacterium]|nr:lipoate--protein ligase family protein [Candidatus Omnitrophota bacterium]MBU0878917.1 lipoate--protein ligase family protein [Candidatus Omnitrophota bacterium]MBU0896678.1 lipoate--protein ligase family protein [Candidatus Omnitrophota bacterium]MBU1134628.1 lipoate--protein ligase family protein [Candidatus Omnitrophota bacterium]MBU1366452.1 lipoate--protein ligase family protein [Candidatus Omnitrophota bacterium]